VNAVAQWIHGQTGEGAPIFVWGNVPELYLDAARPPASRFVYLLPLLTPGYADATTVNGVLAEWQASPPFVIVDAGSTSPGEPGLPQLLIPRATLRLDGRNLDILDPLRAHVAEYYRRAAIVDGWPIYIQEDLRP
jgi:hypothetical protein